MDMEEELEWLVKEMRELGQDTPKTIIYCGTINKVSDMYEFLVSELEEAAFGGDGEKTFDNNLVGMYHGSVGASMEEDMIEGFRQPDGLLRVMICTIAFGMGVQINNVTNVIHWGVSKSVYAYWQETGRCARDGRQGHSYLYATKVSMIPQRTDKNCIKLFKDAASGQIACLRTAILEIFILENMDLSSIQMLKERVPCSAQCADCTCQFCTCCTFCKNSCPCT